MPTNFFKRKGKTFSLAEIIVGFNKTCNSRHRQ